MPAGVAPSAHPATLRSFARMPGFWKPRARVCGFPPQLFGTWGLLWCGVEVHG